MIIVACQMKKVWIKGSFSRNMNNDKKICVKEVMYRRQKGHGVVNDVQIKEFVMIHNNRIREWKDVINKRSRQIQNLSYNYNER